MPIWGYIIIIGVASVILLACFFWRLEEIFNFLSTIKARIIKFLTRERRKRIEKWNFLTWREDKNWYSTEKLIAHAAGGLVRLNYTNSKDALAQSMSQGFKVVEIDVGVSADGKLLCTHENYKKNPPMTQAFLSEKQDGRFTRMALETCLSLLEEDTVLIIDVKDKKQLGYIANSVKEYTERQGIRNEIVFQIFKEEDLKKVGDFSVLYNLTYAENYQRATGFCLLNGIHAVSIFKDTIYKTQAWRILLKHNVKVFAHTVNSLEEYQELKNQGVAGVFTDFLIPADLEEK